LKEALVAKKLYVGNLTYGVTDSDLQNLFSPHGTVQSAQVIMDRDTGRSKGFGFVEMDTSEQAQAAITALNGKETDGRVLTVNEAKPREERSGGRPGFAGGKRY
jgi:RNA recognition motif-containing protein